MLLNLDYTIREGMSLTNNMLALALTIHQRETFSYSSFLRVNTNSSGVSTPVFRPPVNIQGVVLAVENKMYHELGIGLGKAAPEILLNAKY